MGAERVYYNRGEAKRAPRATGRKEGNCPMELEKILAKELHNGSIYDLEVEKPLKMRKAFEGEQIFRHTVTRGAFGVEFKHKKQYTEAYQAEHTEEVPEWLRFEWVVKNLIGRYLKSGKLFIRLNDIGVIPTVDYFKVVNGQRVAVDKAEAVEKCLASEFNHKPNDSGCITHLLSNVVGFAEGH